MEKRDKLLLLVFDVLMVLVVILIPLFTVQSNNSSKEEAARVDYVEHADVLGDVARSYLQLNTDLANNLRASVDGRGMTVSEAMGFFLKQPLEDGVSVHLVWKDSLKGYSTQENSSSKGDYSVDYGAIKTIFSEDGDGMQITKRYMDPVNGFPVIAIYGTLALVDQKGEPRDAYMMYVIPEQGVLKDWTFPTRYDDSESIALIRTDGTYILRPTEMKNETFFDYIYYYNREEVDTQSIFNKIAAGENGFFYGEDYRGDPTLFTYSAIGTTGDFAIVTAIHVENLSYERQSFALPAVIILAMLLLLVVNLVVYNRMEQKLKKNEESLTEALALAEQASRAKTEFLNNMSHDIRTPMNAIIGYTELAKKTVEDVVRTGDYLEKISLSGRHLLSLINDILEMSRIESGRITLSENREHLPEILHNLRTLFHAEISAKNMEFYMDAADVRNEDVVCDKLRLNQILINLLGNAIKFTKPGGKIGIRIIQKGGTPAGFARYEFRVIDNGIGISKEFVKTIFEPFERDKNMDSGKIQGTGLGLAITKRLVDLMGGEISVESTEGKGSEFVVDLTFKVAEGGASQLAIPKLKGLSALVADDDTNTCFSVCKMLEEIGMNAEWTTSGKEAVVRARYARERHSSFAVYIIDLLIPDMNGIEVVRRIRREIGDEVPIVILTAYDWTDIEMEARAAGVTAFCAKPLFMSELLEALRRTNGIEYEQLPAVREELRFDGKRLLLVEDNSLNAEIASIMLRESGFEVEVAGNGLKAVEAVQKAPAGWYDIALMDLRMPVMDGYEATRRIHELDDPNKAQLKIVAMTANAFDEDIRSCIEAGMLDHISKPIDRDKMLAVIARYCSCADAVAAVEDPVTAMGDEEKLRWFYQEVHGSYDEAVKRLKKREMVLRMLDMFARDDTVETLKAAVEQGDVDAAFTAAHTLKGMCGNLSLSELFAAASDLTEQLRPRTQQPSEALLQKVLEAHERVTAALARITK